MAFVPAEAASSETSLPLECLNAAKHPETRRRRRKTCAQLTVLPRRFLQSSTQWPRPESSYCAYQSSKRTSIPVPSNRF